MYIVLPMDPTSVTTMIIVGCTDLAFFVFVKANQISSLSPYLQVIITDSLTLLVSCSTADRVHNHESANLSLGLFHLARQGSRSLNVIILDVIFEWSCE